MRPALVVVARAPETAQPESTSASTPGGEPNGGSTPAQTGTTPSENQ